MMMPPAERRGRQLKWKGKTTVAERKTIYLPDRVVDALQDAQTLSSRIAAIVLRYRQLCRDSLPKLTKAQWCAIFDANNGCDDLLLGDHPETVGLMLWANVADSPGLGEKWEIDQDALVSIMRDVWTPAEKVAAYEASRTFWLQHELPTDEALQLAVGDLTDAGA